MVSGQDQEDRLPSLGENVKQDSLELGLHDREVTASARVLTLTLALVVAFTIWCPNF